MPNAGKPVSPVPETFRGVALYAAERKKGWLRVCIYVPEGFDFKVFLLGFPAPSHTTNSAAVHPEQG